jgi:hypothetical protein
MEGGTPPRNVTLESIRDRYNDGMASNDVAKAGLLIHCFDGTENVDAPWKPCTSGACRQFQWWWSASFINLVQPDLLGTAGIILSPKYAKVECEWDTDMGSMNSGCGDKEYNDGSGEHNPFPPDRLAEMMNISMVPDSAQHKAGEALGVPVYNEVIVNSTWFIDHLPGSVDAIVYFEDSQAEPRVNAGGVVAKDTREVDKLAAYTTYVALLDAYNLTEENIPLISMTRGAYPRPDDASIPGARTRITDMSLQARSFVAKHAAAVSKIRGSPKLGSGNRRFPDFPREKFDHAVDTINDARRSEKVAVRPAR